MADHEGLQLLEHVELRVEIVLEEPLVRSTGNFPRLGVHGPIVVDRDRVDVMHGSDEEFKGKPRQGLLDEGERRRTDPVDLESDQDLDLRGVFVAQPRRLAEECGFVFDQPLFCDVFFILQIEICKLFVISLIDRSIVYCNEVKTCVPLPDKSPLSPAACAPSDRKPASSARSRPG